jgi:hypothetical protein
MANITRADILGAINTVTGAPTCGIVHDVTPALIDAILGLMQGDSKIENRVVKPAETRKVEVSD